MLTTLLDLLGVACLIAFAYLMFPPAALAVAGVAALLISARSAPRGGRR